MSVTIQRLTQFAEAYPLKSAVIDGNVSYSYQQFYQNLCQVTQELNKLNLQKGDIAAIEWNGFYSHFLLVLACEALGVATYSFHGDDTSTLDIIFKRASLIIGTTPPSPDYKDKFKEVSTDWFAQALSHLPDMPLSPVALMPDDIIRIRSSSGTTGQQKFMAINHEKHRLRINQRQAMDQFTSESRYFMLYSFTVGSIYSCAIAALEAGATIIHNANAPLETLLHVDATHIALLPGSLALMVSRLKPDQAKPSNLCVSSFGGPIPDPLRQEALDRLATQVVETYGTNEATYISVKENQSEAKILSGQNVEVVDEHDHPILGKAGKIRIKSPYVIDEYLDDPEATATMFKNCWFYPGDIAIKTEAQNLILLGREDDLLNIGGLKRPASAYESQLKEALNFTDLAFCEVTFKDQTKEIWLCYTADESADIAAISAYLPADFTNANTQLFIQKVDTIPRTATGKIKRKQLSNFIKQNSKRH